MYEVTLGLFKSYTLRRLPIVIALFTHRWINAPFKNDYVYGSHYMIRFRIRKKAMEKFLMGHSIRRRQVQKENAKILFRSDWFLNIRVRVFYV